ncbi:Variant-specific surface protein, partial [Giardia duodenalis]
NFNLDSATKQCTASCTVPNCARCATGKPAECEQCNPNFNLDSATKQCTASCTVPNCARCATGKPAECEQCNPNFNLDSATKQCEPSSINKSSLSTGAIAGISVAVIAVVGGLVGFLCWWFLCRGKA